MTHTKNVLRAIVIMPMLLKTLEKEKNFSRGNAKLLLTIWLLTKSRLYVTAEELFDISATYISEYCHQLAKMGYTEVVKLPGTKKLYFKLSAKGKRMVNTIETYASALISRTAYLEELEEF